MLKTTKTEIREERDGGKVRLVIDEYAMFSKLNLTSYFIEERGSLKSDFFFDKDLAERDLKEKWDKMVKQMIFKSCSYDVDETNMTPRRFEMVYKIHKIGRDK